MQRRKRAEADAKFIEVDDLWTSDLKVSSSCEQLKASVVNIILFHCL